MSDHVAGAQPSLRVAGRAGTPKRAVGFAEFAPLLDEGGQSYDYLIAAAASSSPTAVFGALAELVGHRLGEVLTDDELALVLPVLRSTHGCPGGRSLHFETDGDAVDAWCTERPGGAVVMVLVEPMAHAAGGTVDPVLRRGAETSVVEPVDADLESSAARLGLSMRQAEILALIATGHSTADIAAAVFLSPFTVRNEVQRILMRFGVHTRAEAVAIAAARGVLTASHGDDAIAR